MAKKITPAAAVKALKETSHNIPLGQAIKMVKRYQKSRKALMKSIDEGAPAPAGFPELGISFSFNKKGIQDLLKRTGCVGIRIYPSVNDANQVTMVLVAFDENGNNLTGPSMVTAAKAKAGAPLKEGSDDGTLDESQINPPYPAPTLP